MRPRRHHLIPPMFFHRVQYSHEADETAPVNLHAFNTNYRALTRDTVDPVIENEIEKFMKKFQAEEEIYVDQNLRENPIIWYRNTSNSTTKKSEEKLSNCTRCKMLSKIKKAKSKLRYKFMTMKLEQNAMTLQSLRNFISSAEAKLRSKGRTEEELKELRDALGIDRVRVKNLTHINRQFFKEAEKAPPPAPEFI